MRQAKRSVKLTELIEALKQMWEDDKEAEGIMRAENQAAREKHLD
jgi:hypothetical protein